MRRSDEHLVVSVQFDTEADVEASATAFTEAVSAIDHQRVFARVLEKYNGIKENIRFDRIELELGALDINDLSELEDELARLLDEALADRIASVYPVAFAGAGYAMPEGERMENATEEEEAVWNIEEKIDVLLYYFRTGNLPGNISFQPDIEQWMLEAIEKAPEILREKLVPVLTAVVVVKRMAYALRIETIISFLEVLVDAVDIKFVDKIVGIIKKEIAQDRQVAFMQAVAMVYLNAVSGVAGRSLAFTQFFLAELKRLLKDYSPIVVASIRDKVSVLLQQEEGVADRAALQQVLVQLDALLVLNGQSPRLDEAGVDSTVIKEGVAGQAEDFAGGPEEQVEVEKVEDEMAPVEEQDEEEDRALEVYVKNAGLVLVASFLPVAFRRLGWVVEDKVVDERSHNKMLLWMNYLAWGSYQLPEYELPLNKVLAGMNVRDAVDMSLELTEEELQAADDMLNAAIQHWSVLKNTSVDGLRTSFLQRNGKLINEDGGWQLYVEKKAYDLLLDRLPWSFSIIKFPWMEKPLYTQWRT